MGLTDAALKRLAGLEPFPQPAVVGVRHPVLLMHGFGMLAGVRRGGHLHDEAMYLRALGVRAYAPNVAPYNTVAVRSKMWLERVKRIQDETGADRINVIAHSMGGLDARYMISTMGLHDRIATLTTVSTPHRGTAIAEYVLSQPDRIQDWLAEFANWLGSKSIDDGEADFHTAVAELTPEHVVNVFNEAVPDHPAVRYYSYAGHAGKGSRVGINPFLRGLNGILFDAEGRNDGMVSVESARWGEFHGTVAADHALQVGLRFIQAPEFDSKDFYTGVVKYLAGQGF